MRTSNVFNKGVKYEKILKDFDENHGSILYNISSEINFNMPAVIRKFIPRYIKDKKYPLLDICKLVQDLFFKISGFTENAIPENIKGDYIEVVSYIPEYMLDNLKISDIYNDGLEYDNDMVKAMDFIKDISNWRNVMNSFTEEQDYLKEISGMKQIQLNIPLDQCIILDLNYWDKIIFGNNRNQFFDDLPEEIKCTIIDNIDNLDNIDNFIFGLDISGVRDLVILTECFKKDWLIKSN